jgi:hypothetical protein
MAGALIGFVLGFAGFVVLRIVARRMEARTDVANAGQVAAILRYAALADWLLMIVLGFFIGPMLASGSE